MSLVSNRIKELTDAAMDICKIRDPEIRHRGGYWLHGELARLDDSTYMSADEWLDFCAVVKIMLEVIFIDATIDGPRKIPEGYNSLA